MEKSSEKENRKHKNVCILLALVNPSECRINQELIQKILKS